MFTKINATTDVSTLPRVLSGAWGLEDNVVYLGQIAFTMVDPTNKAGETGGWVEVVSGKLWININGVNGYKEPK